MSKAIRLSKPFYLGVLVGVPLLLRLASFAINHGRSAEIEPSAPVIIFVVFEFIVTLAVGIIFLLFWYRAWKAIYSPALPYTPVRRVMNLFYPFYNVYWSFKAFWPWGKRYNEYLREKSLPLPYVKEFVFFLLSLYFAILIALAYISFVPAALRLNTGWTLPVSFSVPFSIFRFAVVGLTTYYVCDAVKRLPFVPAESETSGTALAE